jgi:hypothetical protein
MSQMMIERSPRDNGAISRLGYLCVMQRVGYYYYHYCPLTTTSMAAIEKKKNQKPKWNHFLFFGVFVLFRWYERRNTCRIHAEFPGRRRKQPKTTKNQNHLSLIRYSLTSPKYWNLEHHAAIRSRKEKKKKMSG